MIPEFIGRFATITALHELGYSDMRTIVSESTEASALAIQNQLAAIHGIELVITDETLDVLAKEAVQLGTGARGLHRLIGRTVDTVDSRWAELADQGICRVEIHPACITAAAEPTLIAGPPAFSRRDEQLRQSCLAAVPPRPAPFLPHQSEPTGPKSGLVDTSGWSDEQFRNDLEMIKHEDLGWKDTTGSAHKWWNGFEKENQHRLALIHRLAQELRLRQATITEFFLAYVYSNTDNIQANLHYLDYARLKKRDDHRNRPDNDDPTPEAGT